MVPRGCLNCASPRSTNSSFWHDGRESASDLKRQLWQAWLYILAAHFTCKHVQMQIEREFNLGLARLKICKLQRQKHRERQLCTICIHSFIVLQLQEFSIILKPAGSSREPGLCLFRALARMNEFKARIEDEQQVLAPWHVRWGVSASYAIASACHVLLQRKLLPSWKLGTEPKHTHGGC